MQQSTTTEQQQQQPVVTVLGLGLLGSRIVAELASCLLGKGQVVAFDPFKTPDQAKNAVLTAINDTTPELPFKDKLVDALTQVVTWPYSMQDAVSRSNLVIEAIIDDVAAKQTLFRDAERYAPSNALFTTNTLQLRLGDITKAIRNPRRLIGLRFLFPVIYIPFVEITRASSSLQNADSAAMVGNFMRSLHKIAFDFDMDTMWEGEQDAHSLMVQRGFMAESLAERHSRMATVGAIRYRLEGTDARMHMEREARVRYDGLAAMNVTTTCVVCLSNPPQVLIPSCGHMVLCRECCKGIVDVGGSACPICRARMSHPLFVFPDSG